MSPSRARAKPRPCPVMTKPYFSSARIDSALSAAARACNARVPTRPTSTASAAVAIPRLNLLNPKMGAFYVAMLPQFIPAGASRLSTGVFLTGVHILLAVVWSCALIVFRHSTRSVRLVMSGG